jgi:hypothetical protein
MAHARPVEGESVYRRRHLLFFSSWPIDKTRRWYDAMRDPQPDWRIALGSEQPHSFARVLRDRKWIVILTVVVAVAAASAYTFERTPLYRTTATMTRDNGSLEQSVLNSTVLSSEDVQRDLVTTSKELTTLKVAERVKQQLNSPRSHCCQQQSKGSCGCRECFRHADHRSPARNQQTNHRGHTQGSGEPTGRYDRSREGQ